MFIHAFQQGSDLIQRLRKRLQRLGDDAGIARARGGDGVQHEWDTRPAARLDGDGDEVEPLFVEGAGEGCYAGEVGEVGGGLVGEDGLVVPETDAGVGGDRGNVEVGADGEEGIC